MVRSPQAQVRLAGGHPDDCLEAFPGSEPDRLQLPWRGACEHLPGGDLRGAVPAGVERHLIIGTRLGGQGGIYVGLSAPREAEGPVRFDLRWEAGVEEQLPVAAE